MKIKYVANPRWEAWAVGMLPGTRHIQISTGLVAAGPRMVAAALAHELEHHRRWHLLKRYFIRIFCSAGTLRRFNLRAELEADRHAIALGFGPELARVLHKGPRSSTHRVLRMRQIRKAMK